MLTRFAKVCQLRADVISILKNDELVTKITRKILFLRVTRLSLYHCFYFFLLGFGSACTVFAAIANANEYSDGG